MKKITIKFLAKQYKENKGSRTSIFLIIMCSIITLLMLKGSENSPNDVKIAVYSICIGVDVVFVFFSGILPLIIIKRRISEFNSGIFFAKKMTAIEKYRSNDLYWIAFREDNRDYMVTSTTYYKEFIPEREFYIIIYKKEKN